MLRYRVVSAAVVAVLLIAVSRAVSGHVTCAADEEKMAAQMSDADREPIQENISSYAAGVMAEDFWNSSYTADAYDAYGETADASAQGSGRSVQEKSGEQKNEQHEQDENAEDGQQENEYADLAIADVDHYVNVRTAPSTSGEVTGKIYDGAVAQVLEVAQGEDGEWFRIVSGNVEGYIKAEFFLYGESAAEVIDEYVIHYATVLADRLNVRQEADIDASRVGYIDEGERVRVLEDDGEWLKVQYADGVDGYVAAQYVKVSDEFVYGKTLEEEARELEERRLLAERSRQPEEQTQENTEMAAVTPNAGDGDSSQLRRQIVDYAMQYLGNRYVHGGQSLAGGTDCSGFTCFTYAAFGYSIGRTPGSQLSGAGRSIDYSQAQPGDIICYGSGGRCSHVALYIGNGQILHAANSRKGVIIGQADYDTIIGVKNVID